MIIAYMGKNIKVDVFDNSWINDSPLPLLSYNGGLYFIKISIRGSGL